MEEVGGAIIIGGCVRVIYKVSDAVYGQDLGILGKHNKANIRGDIEATFEG